MVLSLSVAYALFWVSLGVITVSFFVLINDYEYVYFFPTIVDRATRVAKWCLFYLSIGVLAYSIFSIFVSHNVQKVDMVSERLETKYGVTFNEETFDSIVDSLDVNTKDKDSVDFSDMVKVDGSDLVVVHRGGDLFLMEFKNGSLVEVEQAR